MVSMNRRQIVILIAGVLIVLALWLVGGSVSNFEFAPGHFFYGSPDAEMPLAEGVAGSSPSDAPEWIKWMMFVIVWVLLPLSILFLIFDPKSLKAVLKRVAAVSFWLLVMFMITRAVDRIIQNFNRPSDEDVAATPPEEFAVQFPDAAAVDMPWWTQWAASILFLLLAIGAFYWIHKITQTRKKPESSLEGDIAIEAGQAAAAIRQGGMLQEVILRCYQSMANVLAAKQRMPQEALTPREFERELHRAGIDDPHISKLSRLFERVRYGSYQAESEDEKEALSCLEGIEKRYRG